MPFIATDLHLDHETSIFESCDSDECYRKLMQYMKDGSIFIGRVIEVDANGKKIFDEEPYPHVREAPVPDFFMEFMRS